MLENSITQPSTTEWITAIAAIITTLLALVSVIILAFYTYYTRKIQESISNQVDEQVRQTEELIHQRLLGILPSIFLTNSIKNNFIAHNIGYGIALNIAFKCTEPSFEFTEEIEWQIYYKFENVPQILPNESISINHKKFDRQKFQDGKIYEDESKEAAFSGLSIPEGVHIQVTFQDIEGNKYEQDIEIGKDINRHSFVKRIENTTQ